MQEYNVIYIYPCNNLICITCFGELANAKKFFDGLIKDNPRISAMIITGFATIHRNNCNGYIDK